MRCRCSITRQSEICVCVCVCVWVCSFAAGTFAFMQHRDDAYSTGQEEAPADAPAPYVDPNGVPAGGCDFQICANYSLVPGEYQYVDDCTVDSPLGCVGQSPCRHCGTNLGDHPVGYPRCPFCICEHFGLDPAGCLLAPSPPPLAPNAPFFPLPPPPW